MIFEILKILTVTVPLKPSRFRFSQLSKTKSDDGRKRCYLRYALRACLTKHSKYQHFLEGPETCVNRSLLLTF